MHKSRFHRPRSSKINMLIAVILAAVTFAICFFDLFYTADRLFTDTVQTEEHSTDSRIKIIAMDERTFSRFGQFRTWKRDIYARLIDKLISEGTGPELIAIDILFAGNTEPECDEALAKAAAKHGNVITGANLVYDNGKAYYTADNDAITDDDVKLSLVEKPYDELKAVSEFGFSNAVMDKDGYVRYSISSVDYNGETIDSFAYKIYKQHCALSVEKFTEPRLMNPGHRFGFVYTGKPETYEVVSMCDVLDGTVDPVIFQDSIVLIGAHATGLMDQYNVPVSRTEQMYGVELNANILQSLMDGTTYVNADNLKYAVLAALCVLVFGLVSGGMAPGYGFLFLAAVLAADFMTCRLMMRQGVSYGFTIPAVMFVLAYIDSVFGQYLVQGIKNRQVLQTLNQYVAPEVVSKLQNGGDFEVALGGETREIAVLFIDIRGFTSMSEGLAPEEVVGILNEYLGLVTKAIFDNSGTLDKYIGDAVMALFNAPFDLDDYAYRAVCTARDILDGEQELSNKLTERFGRSISFGIGINLGEAVVGNIGCDFRKDYTAIGDTVNTAARLENNANANQILISKALRDRLGDRIEATEIGAMPLKGKSKEVIVYQLDKVH